jgi:hypothetical protein
MISTPTWPSEGHIVFIISPAHKRAEGHAPVRGSGFTAKVSPQGGIQQNFLLGLKET